ncbi:MAG: hypothetical protein D6B27_09610 [Gammaproteobacteria bacterium]|nr:MAG: hypothetical protein D6B27_09610 [Gammaproteobacteria bacterium]
MGGGSYSVSSYTARAKAKGFHEKSVSEIFTQRQLNNAMNPKGIKVRESRDSDEHPNSVPIIIALDTTGSMGNIPHELVQDGLNKVMGSLLQNGIADPQVLFLGVGDHECDNAPLQVGQFESSDELLEKWLTAVYLERGGGGNSGESYLLSWFFAGNYTAIDSFEKRGKKGFLFTIGDEPTLRNLPADAQREIMGDGQYSDLTVEQTLEKAREKYFVYHIHLTETASGSRPEYQDDWKQLIGQDLVIVDDRREIPSTIADIVLQNTRQEKPSESSVSDSDVEIIL